MASTPVKFTCYVPGCTKARQDIYSVSRHFPTEHPSLKWDLQQAKVHNNLVEMDVESSVGGRPQREKKPTEKVKDATAKPEKIDDGKNYIVPFNFLPASNDPKYNLPPNEIPKFFDHTKTSAITGETLDFYKLGSHVESKSSHRYIRVQRDEKTGYFQAAEAPPFYARLSDEDHSSCQDYNMFFAKDMLAVTNEGGHVTSRANVFAQQGTYYFETKLISISQEGAEDKREALRATDAKKGRAKEETTRGSVRIGLVRREHQNGFPVGSTGYGYGVVTFGNNCEMGNARHQSQIYKVKPNNPGKLREGDVVGLMITLPTLDIHKKVVEGTFNQAVDAPGLQCGPFIPKKTKAPAPKSGAKRGPKPKNKDATAEDSTSDTNATTAKGIETGAAPLPVVRDIVRDRNPFVWKTIPYFESTEYAMNDDIRTISKTRAQNINPATNKAWQLAEDIHPNFEIPHLRTLPGSKLEMWVNGEYQGVVWEHLLAFLPPASYIEKDKGARNAMALSGPLDDDALGYYPAISTYGGGAAQVKFDEPFWFPPKDRPEAKPFGKLYVEHIIDDIVDDLVDQVCWEKYPLPTASSNA